MIPYCKLVVTLPPDDATEISTAAVHAARSGRRRDLDNSMVLRSAGRHAVVVLCRSYTWSIGRVMRQILQIAVALYMRPWRAREGCLLAEA
jgi:hypothetical protein